MAARRVKYALNTVAAVLAMVPASVCTSAARSARVLNADHVTAAPTRAMSTAAAAITWRRMGCRRRILKDFFDLIAEEAGRIRRLRRILAREAHSCHIVRTAVRRATDRSNCASDRSQGQARGRA